MFGLEEHAKKRESLETARRDVHILCSEGEWIVTTAGSDETYFDSLIEAEKYGRAIACREHSKFFVHTEDGQIILKECYAEDSAKSSLAV
jgi:hypothetical protein